MSEQRINVVVNEFGPGIVIWSRYVRTLTATRGTSSLSGSKVSL